MSATKGPIERIRESVNYLASRMSTPQIESVADDVREACDELAARERGYVARYPHVWMLTNEEADALINAISEALNIVGRDKTDGAALATIALEWMASKQAITPQPEPIDNGEQKASQSERPSPWSIATIAKLMRAWDGVITSPSASIDHLQMAGKELSELADVLERNFSDAKPTRIDNGDGTVTFTSVPVTVKADAVKDGSTVIAVRRPTKGERYWDSAGGVMTCEVDSLPVQCIILSDPPSPQFRAGGYYRTLGGEVVGPLEPNTADPADAKVWPWQVRTERGSHTYTSRGTVWSNDFSENDLIPGEVTVWDKPPASLPAGMWTYEHDALLADGDPISRCVIVSLGSVFSDWIKPPKPGRYRVPGGGKVATWEGDA